jgi:hypothetical protein
VARPEVRRAWWTGKPRPALRLGTGHPVRRDGRLFRDRTQPSTIAAESPVIAYPFPAGLPASKCFHVTVGGKRIDDGLDICLAGIHLLEKVPPRSFIVNSGGHLSGVTFQNLRQGNRVLASPEDLGLSVEGATDVRFAR